jgi:glycosyltransferase involved in cell wall biosynthesis
VRDPADIMATLTVFMPNFNHAAYLRQAIEAVLDQSRQPDEFLILDDCSTDQSAEIIESYARRYPVIRFLRRTTNQGAVASINELLAAAKGDYVYGAAADDYVLPGMIEHAMSAAECYPQAGIVFGRMTMVDTAGVKLRDIPGPEWPTSRYAEPTRFLDEFLERHPPYASLSGATIYRRDRLAEVGGFRSELGHWSDTFAIRAIALRYGAAYVPQSLMAWRKTPDSLSKSAQQTFRKNREIIDLAAALMRSSEFSDRFPEAHVRRWQRGYRRAALLLYFRSRAGAVWRALRK